MPLRCTTRTLPRTNCWSLSRRTLCARQSKLPSPPNCPRPTEPLLISVKPRRKCRKRIQLSSFKIETPAEIPTGCEVVSPSMNLFTALARRMAVLPLLALAPVAAFSCDQIPAGQAIWVRLSAPVSTYTAKPGDVVAGELTEAIKCDNDTDYPVGTRVSGVVHSVRKVGWGFVRETAGLTIDFNQLQPANAPPVHFSTAVMEVENAREQVTSKGMIQGVLSSDTPEGRINSRLIHLPTWNPYSDLGLIVYKATFPI